MSTESCKNFYYIHHNNDSNPSSTSDSTTGWSTTGWGPINFKDANGFYNGKNNKYAWGYASWPGSGKRCVPCISFIANIPSGSKPSKVTLNVPFIRAAPTTSVPKEGWVLFRLFGSTDPTKNGKLPYKSVASIIPNINNYDGYAHWTRSDQEWFNIKFEITNSAALEKIAVGTDTYTYITFGTSGCKFVNDVCDKNQWGGDNYYIQCCGPAEGSSITEDGRAISGTTEYYGLGGTGSIDSIADNGDNTIKFTGTIGADGHSGNTISSAVVRYTTDNWNSYTDKSLVLNEIGTDRKFTCYSNAITSTKAANKVKAKVICTFTKGDVTTSAEKILTSAVTYHTNIDVSKLSVEITDNYNNTFNITGTAATGGTSNKATTTFSWGYGNYNNTISSMPLKNQALTISTKTNATRKVQAKAYATAEWGSDSNSAANRTKETSVNIKQYLAPPKPDFVTLSYNKSRLTIKEPWVFTWNKPTAVNNSSPVTGYMLMLRRKRNGEESYVRNIKYGWSKDADGNDQIKLYPIAPTETGYNSDNNHNYYLAFMGYPNICKAVIDDPQRLGFAVGDEVELWVKSFTQFGKDNDGAVLQLDGSENAAKSGLALIRNAGIVRVRIPGTDTWVEGQVYARVADQWKEAETVNVRVNGEWRESQ
jgi:hypothetical protein